MPELTTDQEEALAQRNVMRRLFVWCEAKDPDTGAPAPVGFWDDLGTITVAGRVYNGSGSVGEVAAVSGKSDLSISPMVITLSGIDATAAHLVRGSTVGQAPIELAIGIFDVDTKRIIGPLVRMFKGFVDDIEIKTPKSGEVSTITLTCESIARELTIKSTDTRCHESQIIRKFGDTFFKYTEIVKQQAIYFGRKPPRNKKDK